MFIAYTIVAIVLALVLLFSAWAKLTRDERVVTGMTGVGVPLRWFPFLALCLIAGAVGLLIGIAYAPLGIAAAIGLILYFLSAVFFHLRAGDMAVIPPLALLALAVVALLLRLTPLVSG